MELHVRIDGGQILANSRIYDYMQRTWHNKNNWKLSA
jgi:hypothetical protein